MGRYKSGFVIYNHLRWVQRDGSCFMPNAFPSASGLFDWRCMYLGFCESPHTLWCWCFLRKVNPPLVRTTVAKHRVVTIEVSWVKLMQNDSERVLHMPSTHDFRYMVCAVWGTKPRETSFQGGSSTFWTSAQLRERRSAMMRSLFFVPSILFRIQMNWIIVPAHLRHLPISYIAHPSSICSPKSTSPQCIACI